MKLKTKKLKYFFLLYWIRILVGISLAVLMIIFVFVMLNGVRAWNESESYLRQSQLASYPLQIFLGFSSGLFRAPSTPI